MSGNKDHDQRDPDPQYRTRRIASSMKTKCKPTLSLVYAVCDQCIARCCANSFAHAITKADSENA
jgi:epoxyqueuosine reductase QueG